MQFFLPKNYALFKELPLPPPRHAEPAEFADKIVSGPTLESPARGAVGGRDWNRTSDLVLIRDAL